MNRRKLGSSSLVVPSIGLGTAAFTGVYGPVTVSECARVVGLAIELGMNMLDTADFYANGEIERLLGRLLPKRREDVVIATHGGLRVNGAGAPVAVDNNPLYLIQSCEASLRRLRVDCIDLFFLSRIDHSVPLEDSMGVLAELVAAGKIRHLGLCEVSARDLRRAHAVHPISAVAAAYSLRNRAAEKRSLAVATELGVGVVAYCPIDCGRLSGDRSRTTSTEDLAALQTIESRAAELDLGVARLALAWLLAWRDDLVPVPSTRSLAHTEMNASAANIELTPAVRDSLAGLFPPR